VAVVEAGEAGEAAALVCAEGWSDAAASGMPAAVVVQEAAARVGSGGGEGRAAALQRWWAVLGEAGASAAWRVRALRPLARAFAEEEARAE